MEDIGLVYLSLVLVGDAERKETENQAHNTMKGCGETTPSMSISVFSQGGEIWGRIMEFGIALRGFC